ncbi:unnamed protein product [Ectocarpus sp. 12 AP-2014]
MKSRGIGMDVVSYGTAVSACAKAGDVKGALKLLKEMQEAGVEPNTVVYNSALDACGRAGKPKVAEKLLRKMGETGVVRDATSYTGAIVACSRNGDGDKALEWLETMSEEGIAPEAITYNYAMAACGRSGNDRQAEWLLNEMRGQGVTPNRISYSAAMFALGKAGRLPDVLSLLEEMHREGVEADEVTRFMYVLRITNGMNDSVSIRYVLDLGCAMDLFREMRARGLPVTKRRVEYIQAKISSGGGRSGGGRKNDRLRVKERTKAEDVVATTSRDDGDSSSRNLRAVKKVSRGALHGGGGGGGGVAQGKSGKGGSKAADGEEEAGADFLEELRQRFAVETDELASDSDLDLLADDVLLAGATSSGKVKPNGEAGAATTSTDVTGAVGDSPVSGVDGGDRMSEDGRSETDETVAEIADEEVRSDISGQGEEDTNKAQLVLEGHCASKVTDLKVELKGRGLRVSGNKAELLARLEEALQQPAA